MYKTAKRKRVKNEFYNDIDNIKEALAVAGFDAKKKIKEILSQSLENATDRSLQAKETVANYAADRPFKSLGIALLTGLVVGYFIHRE